MIILEAISLSYNLKYLFSLMEICISISQKTFEWFLLQILVLHVFILLSWLKFIVTFSVASNNYLAGLAHFVQCCCMWQPVHWFIIRADGVVLARWQDWNGLIHKYYFGSVNKFHCDHWNSKCGDKWVENISVLMIHRKKIFLPPN